MSSSARKKERHRLKREKKKAEIRRATAGSPYRRIGERGTLRECSINRNWRESGQATILVLRENPGGGLAVAGFFVDLWCAGLKDAWGRLDISFDEYQRYVRRISQQQEMISGDFELAQRLVSGGIRFAIQNGFRLPRHHDRWVAMLGDVGDPRQADLIYFGKDGKLLWVGPLKDLRQRLIACTPEQFLSRPDVEYIAGLEGDLEEDEEDIEDEIDACEEELENSARVLATKAEQWLRARGEEPAPQLYDAWCMILGMGALGDAEEEEWDESDPMRIAIDRFLKSRIGTPEEPRLKVELKSAMAQIIKFADQTLREVSNEEEAEEG